MLTEKQGCDVLARVFRAAGFHIEENVPFAEDGVAVSLDGWDAKHRVGYEFVTNEAGDRAEFTPHVIANLEQRMLRGELYVLLIDEKDIMTEGALTEAAESFLALVRAHMAPPSVRR
jgi:hypothetical protein